MLITLPAFAAESLLPSHNAKAPIEIDADSLEVLQEKKQAIFSGNVVAKQSNVVLRASKMTVFYSDKASNSKNAITKIEVVGNVHLATPKETASGSAGVYDTVRNYIILTGDVVLTRDKNILKGNRLDFDINSGYSKLDGGVSAQQDGQATGGRVRGLFVPEGAE